MIINETNIKLFNTKARDVELMKVLNGYLIEGKNKNVSERIQIGDTVKYCGRTSGMEVVVLSTEVKKVLDSLKNIESGNAGVRFENGVIDIYTIIKTDGKYESKEKKFSLVSFTNMIESVHKLIAQNSLSTFEKLEEYSNKLDSESEEGKACRAYIDLTKDHCFNFTLVKYDSIVGDERSSLRTWYIWDFNDIELRALKEFCDEFDLPSTI